MVERIAEFKKNLAEIATILNQFNSEAVQLRILELLFDEEPKGDEKAQHLDMASKPRVRIRTKKPSPNSSPKNVADEIVARKPKKLLVEGAHPLPSRTY